VRRLSFREPPELRNIAGVLPIRHANSTSRPAGVVLAGANSSKNGEMKMPKTLLVLTVSTAVALFSASGFHAAKAQQEYKPEAIAKTLHHAPLPGVEGHEIIVKHFAFPPGHVGGKHSHPGSVFVYVVEGTLTVETAAGTQEFGPGDLYPEELNTVMQGRNLSATDDLEIVVFQIGEIGKPMMVKAE
jgi:quercetin dioxygenase-like cupin family protein